MLTHVDIETLSSPFPDNCIGIIATAKNKDKTKIMLVKYLQHTDVYIRLEEVDPKWSLVISNQERTPEEKDFKYYVTVRLTVMGITRENIGEGHDPKGALSDAIKRAAMLFGVGRYLYDEEVVWVPYNEATDKYKRWTIEEFNAHKKSKPQTQSPQIVNGLPGDFVVNFGKKYRGKKIKDFDIEDLARYIAYIESESAKNGKPPILEVKKFIDTAKIYLEG